MSEAKAQPTVQIDMASMSPEDRTLILWNEALARMADNRPRAAIEILEPLVSALPDVTRIRLELARAYFQTQDDDKARFHFERALGDPLSDADRAAVLGFLDAIEARKRWEFGVSVAVISESNPGQRTSAETINIGGLRFTLTDTAEDSTGIETRLSFGVLPPVTTDVSGRFVLTLRDKSFDNEDFDDRTVGGEAGFVLRADGGAQYGAGVLIEDRKLAGAPFSEGRGIYADATALVGPATRATMRVSYKDLTHDTVTSRDGPTRAMRLSLSHVVNSRFAIRSSLNFSDIEAEADWEKGQELGISVGATYAFDGGLTLQVDAGVSSQKRDAAAPLFLDPRDDTARFVAVSALYREFEIQGFTPVLGVRYDTRNSPIPLFDYDNTALTFGFTRLF
ncbi:MAG: DUF560 domain-containing protein [Rhodobacteraceae bacterium]|nr:DUF560 domain-containing protein [Paracoccaceae bacterium]